MHKRKEELFLLFLVGVLVLVSVAAGPSLVYASPAGEYDYVGNNLSDVDTSPDKGIHSNFTAQQYGPDSIYDTLTEENTGGVVSIVLESYSIYESATGATSHTVDKPSGVVEGDLLIAVMSTDGSGEDHTTPSGWTTIFEDFNTGGSTFSVWYKIAATEPDSYTFTVGSYESCILSILRISGHDPTNSINVYGGPDSSNNNAPTCPSVTTTVDNCFILRIFGVDDDDVTEDSGYPSGHTGVFVRGSEESWGETSAGVAYTTQATAGETGTASFSLTANEQWGAVTIAIKPTVEVNYELDLEVQWTNATYTQTYEELCIYGGTIGSEDIRVDVWTGSIWQNLFTDLSSGWNNISVTDYLVDSLFTIRFKGGIETGDTSQDTWQIDCTLLHTWVVAPVANFSFSPEYPYQGDTVTFNASASYDPDGVIVSHFWDFGDGTNATGEITTHIYTDDGNYTISLTITDNDGLSDTTSKGITVLNRLPVASFTESAEIVYTGEVISFNARASYDPDGSIVSYFWEFGDGTNATGVIAIHAYADDGNYTVTLTVTDNDGATASASATKTILNRSPVAMFTESATTVLTDEIIYFDASDSYDPDGSVVGYFWDFGDGNNANGVIIDHSYADDGDYTVTLTVTDDDGATGTATATKTILNRPPVALFAESAETVYTGEVISFNASSSYDPDGSVVGYFWDFGDGTNTTGVTTEHSYPQEGNYTVTLTVTDDDGATNSTSASKTVLNRLPVASFTESEETVYTDEIIYFNATGSYDLDGTITSYFWDFGDGTNATGVTVNYSYIDNGNYTVTLTVTDNDGATDSAMASKTVLNRPPVASFTESAETVYTNETVTFNASDSYDPDGVVASYFWNFGDGTNATGVAMDHAYADDGNYTVTLTVTDDDGATDTATATKTVLNRAPLASFTESATTVYTGETIYFDASGSSDSDGSIVSYFWDFGDGTNATGVVVDHSYVDNGNYTVTLTVTDDDGATDTATATKTVLNRSPVPSFTESAEAVYTNETIYFNASDSYDPDGVIVSFFWDFGDGTNATGVTTDHSYPQEGNYTVTLTVTDDDGATASTSSVKTVLNRPPIAMFTESADIVYTGETITFNASDSYDPDGYIVSYFWDFGDGSNATGIVVGHAYADDGVYTVTLTVTDDDNATASASATKTILNRPPVALFTESAEIVYTGEVIVFNASASYDPEGSIVSYIWDFGDTTNATGVVVSHAYADDGNNTVMLTVTDDDGATASISATKTILNRSPVASFTESATTVLTGEVIYFNASASYDPDGSIISYFWDFGDGTNSTGMVVDYAYADNGIYIVTLTVTDDDDITDTATSTKTVLNRPPVALFTESAETIYTGETMAFNASDSYDLDGYVVSYFWDFGDGTNSTGVSVERVYADDGIYTVTLTVTDDEGATASTTATKTVLNRPPTASFTESIETVLTDEIIAFNASDSYDLDGYVVSYFWDFGDGTNSTGVSVEHSYADDGNYIVTLTVTDDDGTTDTATSTKTVLNRPPVASFTESATTVFTGEAIYFNASGSYDPDGSIANYFWDFGDGTNATGVTVEHSYANDGVYTVVLTVTDDDGATDSASAVKTVLNRAPIANFTESAETVYTGETITFNASDSYDPDGYIVSYFWEFGDGTNATGVVVEHAYSDDGNYTVTLTVTDDDSATATATGTKTILNRPPVAIFSESAETVFTNEVIYFNASASYDPDGTIVSYFWDFGDGANAAGITVEHNYVEDGNYVVTLTVIDNDGASAPTSSTKSVLNRPPVAIFTESAETVLTGGTITFDASDSYDLDGTIVSYFWDFGDGTNATGIVLGHSYADDGTYIVTLTVRDDDGATDSTTSTKTVLNRSPVAIFTESATIVYTGTIIYFDASDSFDPDGLIVSYFWDFGDSSNATGVVVDHAYADDGSYVVTLTVTDDDGATGTATATKKILNRPPVAIFSESAETVYTGETITFNASASYDPDGVIVGYFWDFGDGTNATGIIVDHAYSEDGSYTVTLTVTDDDGTTASSSATKTVLNKPPVASFTESAETVLVDETIYFNASASYDPDGIIVSYFWDFGDETNATGVTTEHAYTDNGVYTVTLTITDNDGATPQATATKSVEITLPVAIFTESAEIVYTGEFIYFNASDSYDPDGIIVSYFWDFGDGTNATGMTVDHVYADDGNYTVTLTVTDDDDTTDTTTSAKTILNRSPVASFTESTTIVYTGEVIHFNASDSYDSDGSIVGYFWDFGDGTNATGVTVEHDYSNNGNYTVTLTVTDDDGATDTAISTKTILNRSPVAIFTESAESVLTGEVIYFNASASYDPGGSIVIYFWDFGDGTNATGAIVDHAYSDDGIYTVTLNVSDDDGATDTATSTKTVLNRSPVAIFTESAETVYTSGVITFNASESYDPDGVIVSYFWGFGDGTNATGVLVDHFYVDDGNYTATLTVTDNDGASDICTSTKTVLNRPPIASFTENTETVYTGEVITLNASSSYDPDGLIVSYFWDFGDGTNATSVAVEHAYSDDGNYTVALTVTDDDGATDTATSTKTVQNSPPIPLFTESAEMVLTSEVIYFNASSSYDSDGSIVGYFWDFGDGTNATGVTTEHAYANEGFFNVTLTVTDDDGAMASSTATKTVGNSPPTAIFTESAETVYTGETITFNASASYDSDGSIVDYFWDFGDGTNATGVIVEYSYSLKGNYTVTLTVTDDDGAPVSSSATKTVLNRSPVVVFTESAETVIVGATIYFNASSSYDLDGVIVGYFWDFGDGTNATGVTTEHAYTDNGVYTVTLTITDNDGATPQATATKSVEITLPVAIFTESAEIVYTGEFIYFNASDSYDPDGIIVSYFWDFGDGTNATGMTVDHVYADDGNYTVTLTVTDDDDTTDTTTSAKTILNRSPVASFTESATTVYTGEVIYFDASSSYDSDGSIVGYFWGFGDGTNATGVLVDHSYVDNGNCTVTLTVTDDDGATDAATATKIVLNRSPVASFTESAETVLTGEIITFNAASYDPDGTITNYFWDFGDGTNATGAVVDHAYDEDRNYVVILTVADDDGATASTSATKKVLNRSPVALFTESAETVLTGEVIYFDASASYDPDGSIVSYFWDFGDGIDAAGVIVEHSYSLKGNYTVILTVTDDDWALASTSVVKTVLQWPPVAIFTESTETAYVGETITFDGSDSYDPDGPIKNYFWDFGDATDATGPHVNHAYADDGNYTVTLTVTDYYDAADTATSTKTILSRSPIASFTESAETILTGDIIGFNASASYDPDGTIVSYSWDFGDGTNETGIVMSHIYVDDGNYVVTLKVTDEDGAIDTATSTKTVLNRDPLALFIESAETVYTGDIITFDASGSYDPDGLVVGYFWDFGDGSNTTDVIAEHTYADDGTYFVTLTVTDDNGASASTSSTKTALNSPPVALFTVSATTVYTGEVITFSASASYDLDGLITNYFWDFGDNNTATGLVVNHAYSGVGRYYVTLTVTDNDMATDSAMSSLFVLNAPPVASFVESAETAYVGAPITFDASGSYDPDGVIVGYFWDFGDSSNTTGVVVEHIYWTNGTFTVTLAVTDDDGASDSVQATKTILENILPIASFTESAETVYTGETIVFNASNSYDPDGNITNYLWNFGDQTSATGVVTNHVYVDDGNYIVTLTVFDDKGANNWTTAAKTVLNREPVASFTESVETAYAGESITFDASGSYDPDGVIVGYFWDFGDSSNTTGVVVEHIYWTNGTFTVTLAVTDDDGASDSVQATKMILAAEFVHDVAILNVTPSATNVYKYRVLNVSAVVANQGTATETLNVTLYASEIHGWYLLETDGRIVWYPNGENLADFLLVTSVTVPTDTPILTFETRYNIEFLYDFGFVQISADEGTTWISLENEYTTYDHEPGTDPNIISNLPGLTGTSEGWPGWRTMTFNLSDYAGETVLLGFRYMTDGGTLWTGWYVDNFTVNGLVIPDLAFEQFDSPQLNVIQTQTVINLASGAQTMLIFSWNTTGTLSGKYSVWAMADIILAETDTLDNLYVDGIVEVKPNPDINGDGVVDLFDAVFVSGIYGCREGEACWDPRVDLVEDGEINLYDAVVVSSNYGKTIP